MADSKPPSAAEQSAGSAKPDVKPSKPVRPPNPVWRMMGLPNISMRLPSRNWMIFLSVTGSITTAIIYDKRETKRAQRKWCKLVEHLALEPLQDPKAMPRRLTVFLEGPPSDGLRVAQDHFKDYIKPILVSSGLDWDFVQGRKEGDVRAELAERIRKIRKPFDENSEEEDPIMQVRRANGTKEFDGPQGDIVIGRNTWKEYIRGLHEGWLGPLTPPSLPVVEKSPGEVQAAPEADFIPEAPIETLPGITIHTSTPSDPSKDETSASSPSPEPSSEKPKKPPQPPPFISPSEYSSASTPVQLPAELDPSVPIHFPHILGFLNTPLRMYRFFNRRHLADQIGRETAAIVLSTYRPYHSSLQNPDSSFAASPDDDSEVPEQVSALVEEEKDWHKSIHKHVEGERERTWLDDIVIDPRISARMRRAELTTEDEERAKRIMVPEEEIEGWIKSTFRSTWKSAKAQVFGVKAKPVSALVEEEA